VELQQRVEQRGAELQQTAFSRLYAYIQSYGNVLAKAFPDKLVKTYRLFSHGSTALFRQDVGQCTGCTGSGYRI
jgi:hypothetical protein